MRKNLGVCSWSLQPSNPADLVSKIAHCGLSSTQLALDPLSSGDWKVDELVQVFDDQEISVCSGMMTTIGEDYTTLESIKVTGGLRPDEHWEENQSRSLANAEVAKNLGLTLVTLHAGFIPDHASAEYKTMTDRIKAIADIFESNGITLALETGQERAEDLLHMLDLPNMSEVGVNFDPANMILYGMGDPAEAIELLRDRIVQVHMKDAIQTKVPGTWGAEVSAGEGEVDWRHFFRVINDLPNAIDVVIEREAGDDRNNDIIKARSIAQLYNPST